MAVRGARALVADVLCVIDALSDQEWQAQSACPGWQVRDVITHLAAFFEMLADPAAFKPMTPDDSAEAANEDIVAARRHHTIAQVRHDYRSWSTRGLEVLAALENPAISNKVVCMGDIGSYPLSAMSEAVCFDHLCHVVLDLLEPRGPIVRARSPMDFVRLAPALDWMLRGLPTMSGPDLAAALDQPVMLELSGPGGRRMEIARAGATEVRIAPAEAISSEDIVYSDAEAFLAWATRRSSWRGLVRLSGDKNRLVRVLDRIRVV
ncbi:maleylpyruvate isomerase N-terminal domain-containing protein [Mycolicibacterium sp. ELW1]|uniref:maleylpyruvate isomerase N-terminal domain-containing protein n=1 Tax=Mycobacteriaceae TaxID=1762 RepID=UPI00257036F7|nr:maleylpyruvate isomerase N-terminal domain-containing protein [Mycobacterium sp. ELW1]